GRPSLRPLTRVARVVDRRCSRLTDRGGRSEVCSAAVLISVLLAACSHPTDPCPHPSSGVTIVPGSTRIQTIFLIVMENHDWAEIHGRPAAPYVNDTLLPAASRAEQYFNPPGLHPSEPNYLWLEAGRSFGVDNDDPPARNHQTSRDHLVTQLEIAGIPWTSYQEGIDGLECPLTDQGHYAPKHNPMVFFDDVTDGNDPHSAHCIAHVRPLTELIPALQSDAIARYVFITPDLCHDMHDKTGCATSDPIRNGDDWLRTMVPEILAS